MKSRLLLLNSSARFDRSVTRTLADRLVRAWLSAHPDGEVIHRDTGRVPPAAIDQAWIASAYARQTEPGHAAALAESESLIAEIEAADVIVIGAPLYNFGMPAVLKLWIEQIIRVGRTFRIVTGADGETYVPLLRSKPVFVVVSAGNPAFLNGGPLSSLNFLRSHLGAILEFLGFSDVTFIEIAENDAKEGRDSPALLQAESRLRESDDPASQ